MCKYCSVTMYADDTVYISVFKLYPLRFYIIQDLQCFFEWLEGKSLVLNVFKTKRSKFSPSSSDGGVGNREKISGGDSVGGKQYICSGGGACCGRKQ